MVSCTQVVAYEHAVKSGKGWRAKQEYRKLKLSSGSLRLLAQEATTAKFSSSTVAIRLWSSLEYMAIRFLGDWLQRNRHLLETPAYRRLHIASGNKRVPLVKFATIADDLQYYDIAHLVAGFHGYQKENGAKRLSQIIGVTGIDVGFTAVTHRWLCELEQMRHTLLHRGRWANDRLKEMSPNPSHGMWPEVWPSMDQFSRYTSAARRYSMTFANEIVRAAQSGALVSSCG